jgi:carboxymethylenebutenolidase
MRRFRSSSRTLRIAAGLLLLLGGVGAVGCVGPFARWTPDPQVAHSDTEYVSAGRRIGVLRMAPTTPGRHPVVLVLHPSDGIHGRGGVYVREFADRLARAGYVAYVVHYFDRTGAKHTNDATEDRDFNLWTDALRDGVTFAQHDSAVDPERIGAFGLSLGGYMALALGAADRRVKSVVSMSGGFFDALANRVRRMPPTLLLHGTRDNVVPVSAAYRVDTTLTRLRVEHSLEIYEGQGHGLSGSAGADAEARALKFLEHTLVADTALGATGTR